MKPIADVHGLVLAGGKSERMGIDKGLLNVHGETMREYMLTQLRSVCSKAYISCRLEQQVPSWMDPIVDQSFTSGPLNGLLSAFDFNPRCAWLAVAVDMPYVNVNVLRSLIDQRDPSAMATCYFNERSGGPEPLLTIWEPSAFPYVKAFVEKGNTSPRHFLLEHSVNVQWPASPQVFRSLNDPDDIMELTEVCDGRLKLITQTRDR
jgi:molybdopterin-guanine dinucleotide biosynthesis protein A